MTVAQMVAWKVDQKVVSMAVLLGCLSVVRKVDCSAALLGFRSVETTVASMAASKVESSVGSWVAKTVERKADP